MPRIVRAVGLALGIAATSRAVAQPTAEQASAAAALRAVFAAAERNDLKALDSLYAGDSLTAIEGTGINRGWAD